MSQEKVKKSGQLKTATEVVNDWAMMREKLQPLCLQLFRVLDMADSGTPSIANQGQALDGYSELANYRSVIEKMKKILEEKG